MTSFSILVRTERRGSRHQVFHFLPSPLFKGALSIDSRQRHSGQKYIKVDTCQSFMNYKLFETKCLNVCLKNEKLNLCFTDGRSIHKMLLFHSKYLKCCHFFVR
jgi:hypothetical protein